MKITGGISHFFASKAPNRDIRTWIGLTVFILLTGCQTMGSRNKSEPKEDLATHQSLEARSLKAITQRQDKPLAESDLTSGTSTQQNASSFEDVDLNVGKIEMIGTVPSLSERSENTQKSRIFRPRYNNKKVDTFVRPLPIPEFIDVVFGGILEQPYVTGPGVASMSDIVQLRSSGKIQAETFLDLVSNALENYGVRIVPENGAYQIIKDEALRARVPRFIKSRTRPSIPNDLRPIVQFVELRAIRSINMQEILTQTFPPGTGTLKMSTSGSNNFITLTGLAKDIDTALRIIEELDDLEYAGSHVMRYSPKYWNVEEFSAELSRALFMEGWPVNTTPGIVYPISLLPVKNTNDLFIFIQSKTIQERVITWINELDKAESSSGNDAQIFIYQVRNVDAELLANIANEVLLGDRPRPSTQASGENLSDGTFTVDTLGNRIIFQGTALEYDKMVSLLENLDTPAPEVLIEVQIAEVTLNDSTNSGVELVIDDLGNKQVGATLTNQGLGQGASGLNITLLSGNVDARINALSTNRRVKLLSTPVIVARSGGAAQIQVGTDIPIITSQAAANTQSGSGTLDILQQVQYRKTGVLLSIEPIVFSDYRIDLTISQEISSTVDSSNSSISSPTISNRNLTTQLSLEDGQTAVMGGLIQENIIRDDKGIPFLKDIPGIGQIFSNDSYSVDRTELVVLITAYVLRGQADKTGFVRSLSRSVDRYIDDDNRLVTLNPIIGFGLE